MSSKRRPKSARALPSFRGRTGKHELELLKLEKEVWAKAVDTQMHFNEMSHKSRQLGLTIVGGALGLAGVIIHQGIKLNIFGVNINATKLAGFVIILSAAIIFFVRLVDVGVYQKLLLGAVKFGWDLESKKEDFVSRVLKTRFGMTTYISVLGGDLNDNTPRNSREGRTSPHEPGIIDYRFTSLNRLKTFYGLSFALLFVAGVVLMCFG